MKWYELVEEKIGSFFNTPAVMWVVNISLVFIYVLVIFAKTSLGKKLFLKVKLKYDETFKIVKEWKKEADDFKAEAEKKYKEHFDQVDQKLNCIVSYTEQLENLLYEVGEVIPNAKVKERIENFKNQKEARREEISKFVGTYEQFKELTRKGDEIEQEIETRVKEQVDKMQELYNSKAQELDHIIEEYKNKVGKLYEKEENTNPEEKAI